MERESVSFISPSGVFGLKGKCPGLDWSETEKSRLSLGASFRPEKQWEDLNLSRSVAELMKNIPLQTFPKGYP